MTEQAHSFQGKMVLVVDDVEEYRATVAEKLESLGATVLHAATPNEARLRFDENKAIDVAIIDLRLAPGEVGRTGVTLARELTSKARVIIVTAYSIPYEVWADALLPKTGGQQPVFMIVPKQKGLPELMTVVDLALHSKTLAASARTSAGRLDTVGLISRISDRAINHAYLVTVMTVVMVTLGTLIVFLGGVLAFLGRTDIGILTGVAGVLIDVMSGLYFVLLRDAYKRLDRLYESQLAIYREDRDVKAKTVVRPTRKSHRESPPSAPSVGK